MEPAEISVEAYFRRAMTAIGVSACVLGEQ
jgi:hypothetical protein